MFIVSYFVLSFLSFTSKKVFMTAKMDNLSTSTWNVNGLGHPIKRKKVFSILNSKQFDVVFLQETHLSAEESEKLCRGWVSHVYYNAGSSQSCGVLTLINRRLQCKYIRQFKDTRGRILIVVAEIQGHMIILTNVYAPNGDEPQFFADLEAKMLQAGDYNAITGGDFNLVMDPVLDRSSTVPTRLPKALVAVRSMAESLGYIDVWRMLNPKGRDYTFFSATHSTFSRIDFFLISKNLLQSVTSCSIGSILASDHASVSLEVLPFSDRIRMPR